MLVFDTSVFLLTLVRSVQVVRLPGGSKSMFQVMLRDGKLCCSAEMHSTHFVNVERDYLFRCTGRSQYCEHLDIPCA